MRKKPGPKPKPWDDRWLLDIETDCHIWQGASRNGYGQVSIDGVVRAAHVVAYERVRGPVAEDLEVDHLCRITLCVNPDHLEAITHRENVRRGALRRLTECDILAIREATGLQREIAKRFGISEHHVYQIKSGRRWADVRRPRRPTKRTE